MEETQEEMEVVYNPNTNLNIEFAKGSRDSTLKSTFDYMNLHMTDDEKLQYKGKPIPQSFVKEVFARTSQKDREALEKKYNSFLYNATGSFVNTAVDILPSLPNAVYRVGASGGAWLAGLRSDADEETKDRIKREAVQETIQDYKDTIGFEDAKVPLRKQKFGSRGWWGQGLGNYGLPLASGLATGNMIPLAEMFGLSNYSETLDELLSQNKTLANANVLAAVSGSLETALEMLTINKIVTKLAMPRIQRFGARFLTGLVQEISQLTKDKVIRNQEFDREEILTAAIFGGLGEVIGLTIRDSATRKQQNRDTKKLVEKGVNPEVAEEFAVSKALDENVNKKKVDENLENARNEYIDTLIEKGEDPEVAANKAWEAIPDFETLSKEVSELTKEEQEQIISQFDEAVNNGGENAAQYLSLKSYIEDKIKGLDIPEEQKEPALKIASVLSTKSWERAKELGMSWEEFQNDLLNKVLIVGDNKPLISNTLGLSNIKDLSAEEEDIIDMMRDRGASDDFIYQAIISKRLGTPLFSQVEMQLENDKLDESNPAYEGETINTNGADKTVYNSDGTKIAKSAEALQNFYNWFGDSKVVDEQGRPLVMFHGSTKHFRAFDIKLANPESDLGAAFYFTNSEADMNNNYEGGGADFENKIERKAENLASEENIDYDEALDRVRDEEYQDDVRYPVYLNIQNPFEIGGNNETTFTFEEEYNEETEEYGEPSGTLIDFNDSLGFELEKLGVKSDIQSKLFERAIENGGEISASEIYDIFKNDEDMINLIDYESGSGDMLKKVVEASGFDGFIDHTVNDKFGSNRKYGQQMAGMDEDTFHAIAFDPNQIKSIYNNGQYSRDNNDILYSKENDNSQNDTKVLGSYQRNSSLGRLITLSKTPNKDTFLHEMSHALWEQYYDLTDKLSLKRPDVLKEVKPLLDYTGKKNLFELMQDADAREKVNEVFLRYLNTNEAPSEAMRPVFGRVKNWAISLYKTIATDNAVSPEIKEYFDKMLSEENDISNMREVQDNLSNIVPILTKIKKGEEATISGRTRQDIQSLLKALHARKPRKAKTLAQTIREMGGVKGGSLLAKQLPQDSQMIKKNGVFSEPEDLGDTLKRLGFYVNTNYENDEQHTQMNEDIVNILNKAETQYSDSEKTQQALVDNYDENIKYAQDALAQIQKDEGLNNLSEVEDLLNKALVLLTPKGKDNVLVNKDVIQYIKSSMFDAKKRVAKMQKQANEERYDYQAQLTNFIRSLPISYKNKDKLIGNIRRVTDEESFKKVLEQVQKQAEKYAEYEQKKLYKDSINNILKATLPKGNKQRGLYDDNKFFEEMRKINTMSKEQASVAMQEILEANKNDEDLLPSEYDILRMQMLSYKLNGNDSSLAVLQNLSDGLSIAYKNMIDSKERYDEELGKKRKELREKLISKLEQNASNPSKARKVVSTLTDWNGDFYSLMNEMFGKEIADEFDMRALEGRQLAEIGTRTAKVDEKGMQIYGIKNQWDWLDKKGELSSPIKVNGNPLKIYSQKSSYSANVSKADIMDIYLGMKNEQTRDLFFREYEEFDEQGVMITNQLGTLLSYLTDEDMQMADALQEDINSHSEEENAAFVRRYGIDMPKIDNYWMRTSATTENGKADEGFRDIALSIPSSFKMRSSNARPRPNNVFQKYQSHLSEATYATILYDKYKEIFLALRNQDVVDAITSNELYGVDRNKTLVSMLQSMSEKGIKGNYSSLTKGIQGFIGRIVGAKVKISPAVFVKQLTSITNYAVGMQKSDYIKGVSYAVSHYDEAYQYMNELTNGFVETREKNGHLNQLYAAQVAKSKSGEASPHAGLYAHIDSILSANVRKGDIMPIVIGGYAKAKYLESQGKSKEEIRDIIIKETLESQQSSTASSTSNFQKSHSILSAFRNTAYQYSRILQNSYLQYKRGEINGEKFAEIYLNYGILQPILYKFAGDLVNGILGLFKDDKKKKKETYPVMDTITEIISQPFGGVPFAKETLRGLEGIVFHDARYGAMSFDPVVLSDLNRSIAKAMKKEKNFMDWTTILTPLVEGSTGLPLGQAARIGDFGYNLIDKL